MGIKERDTCSLDSCVQAAHAWNARLMDCFSISVCWHLYLTATGPSCLLLGASLVQGLEADLGPSVLCGNSNCTYGWMAELQMNGLHGFLHAWRSSGYM